MGLFNFKKNRGTIASIIPVDENLSKAIEEKELQAIASHNETDNTFEKGFSNKKISYATPVTLIGSVDTVAGKTYREKGGSSRYRNLNDILNMYSKRSVINPIITLRANQVATYGTPSRYSDDGVGFEVRLKDKDKKPKKEELEEIKNIEEFLHYTSNDRSTNTNFRTWLKQTVRDILVYDQANTELVYERNSRTKLRSFYAVDAGTVYYVVDKETGMPITNKTSDKYVQKIGDERAVFFKEDELTFDVMNPRTDLSAFHYGLSPLEVTLNQVAYHTTTEEFNNLYFTQGGTTNGLLLINPGEGMTQQTMDDFRREWTNRFQGANGAWTIPAVAAQDAKFVAMNQSQKDMEFEKWINYLINIITSNFGVDPAEIGFPNRGGATGAKGNSLQESSKSELSQLSKDKGLSPLLDFIEDIVNDNIVSRFNDGKYIFKFKGNELAREIQLLQKYQLEVTTTSPLNEVRKDIGKDPVIGGDSLLNQHYINRLAQIQAQENFEKNFKYQEKQDKLKQKQADSANAQVPSEDNLGQETEVMQNGQPKATQSEKQRNKGD